MVPAAVSRKTTTTTIKVDQVDRLTASILQQPISQLGLSIVHQFTLAGAESIRRQAMGNLFKTLIAMLLERNRLVMLFTAWNIVLLCLIFSFLGTLNPTPWHANKLWHGPVAFPRCSMDACFNFTRCERHSKLLIYTYNDPVPKGLHVPMYLESLPGSEWHTTDPEQACLFFYFSDTEANKRAWTKPAFSSLPFWNGGLNHVIVTFADRWEDVNPAAESLGFASLLSTKLHPTTYRSAFDIAIPLPRSNPFVIPELYGLNAFERKYFLTFKGKRYLSREGVFRSSEAFWGMHNGEDVVVALTCLGKTNTKALKLHPGLAIGCKEGQEVYDGYDYMELMNSTFALAPAGRSPASYRMFEVMSNGAIPVLIADNYVKPFETLIQWQYCVLQFPTNEVYRVLPTLRGLARKEVEERQRYCKHVFQEFLKDDVTLVRSVIRSFKERFMGMMSNFPLDEDFVKGLS